MELQGEFKKIRPPTFDHEKEEDEKQWLLNIMQYLQFYENDSNWKGWK